MSQDQSSDYAREFHCADCGIHVTKFVMHANDQDLCLECQWLREIDDPEERRQLRELLRRTSL